MICYKDGNDQDIPQVLDHEDVFNALLDKSLINLEQNFEDEHMDPKNNEYKKIFNQIDLTLLFYPNRYILFSVLENLDRFCELKYQISIYPFFIYKQIINIGTERIHDFQIVSKVLSISLYICSFKEESNIIDLEIFQFLYKVINFFYDIQLKARNDPEEQVYDEELKIECNYFTFVNNYFGCFNQAIYLLSFLEPFYDPNDKEIRKLISHLLEIMEICMPSLQDANEDDQEANKIINFPQIFELFYQIIPLFHFVDDEMIQINNFIIAFIEQVNLEYYNASFLKAIYQTKSWQYNIFNIFNNEIFINYIKNCLSFINRSFDDEDFLQIDQEYQNLLDVTKYTFKIMLKINSSFPEIFDVNFEALNGQSKEYFINSYFKCAEKTLKMDCLPTDLLALFEFSFDCFLNCEFKIQKSSIGLIFELSEICIDGFYQNIIECLDELFSFIESGNIEITMYILKILINTIRFCNVNDQESFDAIIDAIIQQNILQMVIDIFTEDDEINSEIDDLVKCIDEYIPKDEPEQSNM